MDFGEALKTALYISAAAFGLVALLVGVLIGWLL